MDNFDQFKNYMNKIEADTELKENTKKYVREALSNRMNQRVRKDKRTIFTGSFFTKKILAAACSVAACAFLSVGGYAYYITPVNYVSLDINPSVELGVNGFDKVVSAKGINDEGKSLVKEQRVTHMSVEDAISALIVEAAGQNYINEDGTTVIAVTAESEKKRDASDLQRDCIKGIDSALGSMNINAIIYKGAANLDIRTEAENLNISPGKLKLIQYLQTLDPGATIDQYRNSSITEIIDDANELLMDRDAPDSQNEELNGIAGEIMEAAEQLQEAREDSSHQGESQSDNDFIMPESED